MAIKITTFNLKYHLVLNEEGEGRHVWPGQCRLSSLSLNLKPPAGEAILWWQTSQASAPGEGGRQTPTSEYSRHECFGDNEDELLFIVMLRMIFAWSQVCWSIGSPDLYQESLDFHKLISKYWWICESQHWLIHQNHLQRPVDKKPWPFWAGLAVILGIEATGHD